MPVFSFEKIRGADISLGPEMKSTGECLGIAKTFDEMCIRDSKYVAKIDKMVEAKSKEIMTV